MSNKFYLIPEKAFIESTKKLSIWNLIQSPRQGGRGSWSISFGILFYRGLEKKDPLPNVKSSEIESNKRA